MFGFFKRWFGIEKNPVENDVDAKDSREFLAYNEEWATPTEWFLDTDGKKVRKKCKRTCCGGGCHNQVEEVPNQAFDPINPLATLLLIDTVNQNSVEEVQETVGKVDVVASEPVDITLPPEPTPVPESEPTCTFQAPSYDPPSYSPPPPPSYDCTPTYSPPPPPPFSDYGGSSDSGSSGSSDSSGW